MKPRQWYRIEAKADAPSADLYIYSDIGASYWDDNAVTARQFIADLNALPPGVTALNVHVNSLGGDVFEAVGITNALRAWGTAQGRTVTTMIEGIAASAASVVIMAGTRIVIADNALVMVHNPYTIAMGNAADLRKTADALDVIRNTIVATYKWHSTMSDEELVALIDAETWMDADTAIANGFATEKIAGLPAAAALESRVVARLVVPEPFKARVTALLKPAPAAPHAASATDVLRLCREAGVLDLAEELVASGATPDQVTARLAAATTARAQAQTRADEITAVCAVAKLPELAAGYIAGGMPVADVRGHVTTITAKLDRAEIDANLSPDQRTSKPALSAATIYADRNRQTAH